MTPLPGRPAWLGQAIDLYRSGLSAHKVADQLGLKTATVRYHFKRVPELIRPSNNPWREPPWAAEAERLYRAGSSKRGTAEQLIAAGHSDATEGRVLRALVGRGVPIRHPRAAAQRNRAAGAHLVGRRRPISQLSSRTLQDYRRRWERFGLWCADNGRPVLPTTEDTLREFIAHMASRGHCSTYLSSHLSSVRFHHDQAGEPMPPVTLPQLMPRSTDGEPAAVPLGGYRPHAAAGLSANDRTLAGYERRWAAFARWCNRNGHVAEMPVPVPVLMAYKRDLERTGYSGSHINGQIVALRARHVRAGQPFPARLDHSVGGSAPLAELQVRAAA